MLLQFLPFFFFFFFLAGFSFTGTDDSQDYRRREGLSLLLMTNSTLLQTFRHFLQLYNYSVCNYRTPTHWNLPHSEITIWLIDDGMLIYIWLIDDVILDFFNSSLEQEQGGFELASTITIVNSSEPTNQLC